MRLPVRQQQSLENKLGSKECRAEDPGSLELYRVWKLREGVGLPVGSWKSVPEARRPWVSVTQEDQGYIKTAGMEATGKGRFMGRGKDKMWRR